MKNKYTFLQPTYYKDFQCSGSNCNLNCCNYNWNITIDKDTYLKYRNVKEPKDFLEKLNKYVKRNRNSKGKLDYAKLVQIDIKSTINFTNIEDDLEKKVQEDVFIKGCSFQDENGLCEIHKNLGIDALSYTCKIFPRIFNNMFGNYERSLSLGCEEVSKLLYNAKDGVGFELVEVDDTQINLKNAYLIDLSKSKSPFLQYFDTARLICLNILQLDELSIDNRMILLGAFMFKLDELVQNKNFDSIPTYMDTFLNNISAYEPLFNIKTVRQDNFLEIIVKSILFISGKGGRADTVFDLHNIMVKLKLAHSANLQDRIISIKIDGEETLYENNEPIESPLVTLEDGSVISKVYTKYKENVERLMEGKEYYITNLLSHIFFSKSYPFDGTSIKDCYINFVWCYCYYKGLLAGYLGERETLDEDLLHRICTITGRTLVDQNQTLRKFLTNLKDNNLDNLPFLAVLIKSA
nr:flagellin lysine-N-methylase [uncultured Tyzzerella sp.]